MCGRTCLTLEPPEIVKACRYKNSATVKAKIQPTNDCTKSFKTSNDNCSVEVDDKLEPEWRSEFNCGRCYLPSYNVAPTDITPVLVSRNHFDDENDVRDINRSRIIVPMMWGMIPFWHRGDYRKHGLSTNNCRLEHMLESRLYRGPFRRGQRCIILCEGFYEWQTTKPAKPAERVAHLLFMPQSEHIKIYDRNTWQPEDLNLLKMAGLFDVWEDEQGDKMYSYSVITFESSKIMSWLHHRMPAILETEQQINNWLDFKNVSDEQALATLRPCKQLRWHRVSNFINNSRNKSEKCNKPMEMVKEEKPHMNRIMSDWLNVRRRREEALVQSGSGVEKVMQQSVESVAETGGDTTSESESELSAAKRPRYRDYKQNMHKSKDGSDVEDFNLENNTETPTL